MSQNAGLGQPGPNQPDFLPTGSSLSAGPGPVEAGHMVPPGAYGPGGSPAPSYPPPAGFPPPGGYPPAFPPPANLTAASPRGPATGRRWVAVVAGVAVIGLGATVIFGQFQFGTRGPTPVPSPAPVTTSPGPSIVRTATAPAPSGSVPVNGGEIGSEVTFTTAAGTGRVTVLAASWTTGGPLEPAAGNEYLVLDLSFRGVSGRVVTGLLFTTVVDARGESHSFTIGPVITNQLPTRVLGPGETSTGQLAFELPRGPVTVVVSSETLQPVAEISVP